MVGKLKPVMRVNISPLVVSPSILHGSKGLAGEDLLFMVHRLQMSDAETRMNSLTLVLCDVWTKWLIVSRPYDVHRRKLL